MASRFRAWLRRKAKLSGKKQYRKTTCREPNLQKAASNRQNASPPPPYDTLHFQPKSIHQLPRTIDGSESIEVLRARNPATRPPAEDSPILRPPRHTATPIAAVEAAARAAVIGLDRALDEPDPKMVAARTAQAIAVAVSTSRSYAAFVAAVTAVESNALLLVEDDRDHSLSDLWQSRARNAIRAAVVTAMAADAGITPIGPWPFNIYDSNPPESLSQTIAPSSDQTSQLTNLALFAPLSQCYKQVLDDTGSDEEEKEEEKKGETKLDEVQQQQQRAVAAATKEDAAAVHYMF